MPFPPGIWKWALALLATLLSFAVPLPESFPPLASQLQWGIGTLVGVCLLGKLLYDTLFYDRYRP